MTTASKTKTKSAATVAGFPCRDCRGTGVDRKYGVACCMCNGAKVITWEIFEERCATIQKLASDVLASEKTIKKLKAEKKALEDKHADVDDVVEDYLATLTRQVAMERRLAS